jgi:hypothetical protein
LASRIT